MKHYLKFWFWLDLVSCMPFDVIDWCVVRFKRSARAEGEGRGGGGRGGGRRWAEGVGEVNDGEFG